MKKNKQLYAAVRDALLADGMNLFFANGGVAGQQAGHFLYHIIPRNKGDGLYNFELSTREINDPVLDQVQGTLTAQLPQIAAAFYQRGELEVPQDLQQLMQGGQKPTIVQLVQLIEQNPQLKEMILHNRPQFEQLCQQHPQLKPLFEGVNLDELIKLLS